MLSIMKDNNNSVCSLIDKVNVPCQEYDDSINEVRLLLQELKDRKTIDDKLLKSTDDLSQTLKIG